MAESTRAARSQRDMLRWGIRLGGLAVALGLMGLGFLLETVFHLTGPFLLLLVLGGVVGMGTSLAAKWASSPPPYVSQREISGAIVQRLLLAPGAPLVLGKAEEKVPLRLTVTLASGVVAHLERWEHQFETKTHVGGRRWKITTTKNATDAITLRFAPGRFPQLPAVLAALQQRKFEVRGRDGELTVTTPVGFVQDKATSPLQTIPSTLAMLHGLLDPTPVLAT